MIVGGGGIVEHRWPMRATGCRAAMQGRAFYLGTAIVNEKMNLSFEGMRQARASKGIVGEAHIEGVFRVRVGLSGATCWLVYFALDPNLR